MMGASYGDSSALAKQYIREIGSSWLIALIDPAAGNRVYTALVTGAEIVAAVARRVRMGSIPASDAAAAIAAFRNRFHTQYRVVRLTDGIMEWAMDLAEHHGLRGYDAVQLACALATRDQFAASGAPPLNLPIRRRRAECCCAGRGIDGG